MKLRNRVVYFKDMKIIHVSLSSEIAFYFSYHILSTSLDKKMNFLHLLEQKRSDGKAKFNNTLEKMNKLDINARRMNKFN